jgi:predicted ATPase/DNA-binding XRE family transcriptional regulator
MRQPPPSFGQLLRQLRGAAALSQAELAERAGLSVRGISDLERDLRQTPRPETARLLADALALDDAARTVLLAAAHTIQIPERSPMPASLSGALPVLLTRLIGREPELAALLALLLRDGARLVTITGVGGSGKTRLALEVAARLRARFADGVVFVDLAPLADPTLVLPSLAAALGVPERAGQPLAESLARFLAPRQTLVLLDNCERVLGAVPALNALLAASPDVTILATSREPLHVRGEREFPLAPLPLPAADQLPAVSELARIPAAALFVERAEASQPTFRLTAENAAAVAAICRRLDGLPLAIELAAVRVKVLPPAALLARLEKRLPLLTGGRDLPARQQTMRDAIAWTYDLLAPSEQALFRRLAVFAGGFTLAAAEAVADPAMSATVFDGVAALVEQSLLQPSAGTETEPRYQLLETVREYGLEQLTAAGETDEVRQRHAAFFLQQAADFMTGSPILLDRERLARVIAEQDNVRLALQWCDAQGDSEALLQLSVMLDGLWFGRGLYGEGLQWAERALDRSSPAAAAPRVRADGGSDAGDPAGRLCARRTVPGRRGALGGGDRRSRLARRSARLRRLSRLSAGGLRRGRTPTRNGARAPARKVAMARSRC